MKTHLLTLSKLCDQINSALGKGLSYLVLILVLLQFSLVVMSSSYHENSILMQELLLYINSLIFLGGAGYLLLEDGHVRVDIFYAKMNARKRQWVDFLGSLFLLTPLLSLLWISGVPYVLNSWSYFEGSAETSGLQALFILKSFILLFALSLTLQGLSIILKVGVSLFIDKRGLPRD